MQWGSYSFAFGPVVALAVVGVLTLLLRWAFSTGHSLVERRPEAGTPEQYGLLVPVAEPPTSSRPRCCAAGWRRRAPRHAGADDRGAARAGLPRGRKAARLVLRG